MSNGNGDGMYPPQAFELLEQLGPGVLGLAVEHEGELWIPAIYSEHRGGGNIGRYLDSLPTDRRVVFPNVVNLILEGMLLRRDFVRIVEYTEELGPISVYERKPS